MGNNVTKILYVCSNSNLSGAPRHTCDLLNFFSNNYTVKGIFGGDGEIHQLIPNLDIELIPELQSSINLSKDLKALLKLRLILKEFAPNIVHVHSFKASLLTRLLCFFSPIKIIYTVHGWPWRGKTLVTAIVAYLIEFSFALLNRSTSYIFVDPLSEKILPIKLFVSKKKTILNGVHYAPSNFIHEQRSEPSYIFVSRVSPGKRHDIAIKGFDLYKKNGGVGSLHLVGEGTETENFKKYFESITNHSNGFVSFYGPISDIDKIYQIGDVVILISDFEALPLSLIEGLSYSKPLIASAVGGIAEIVDETNGILLSKNTVQEVYEAFKSMQSKSIRSNYAKNAKKKYHSKFKIEEMYLNVKLVYESINK
tara:strand:+ start:26381 stop:27481 length:1101 start_codon:yes stop_codon:yes gene_type:complete